MLHSFNNQNWTITREVREDDPDGCHTIVTSTVDPTKQYEFRTTLVKGVPGLNSCPPARFEALNKGIKYRSSDILIATYPKCGTTWSEQTVLLLTRNSDPELLNPVHKNTYNKESKIGKIWPEAMILQEIDKSGGEFEPMSFQEFDEASSPRVIKTHASVGLLLGTNGDVGNLPEGAKVVVVTRNPYDACVSSYYHAFNPAKSGWPFDAWATAWLNGYVMFGDYYEWIKGWYQQYLKYPDRIIWISFEEMKKSPFEETLRLSTFLGTPTEPVFVQKVVDLSSFENMKDQATKKGGDVVGHLRKGDVGDWKNHFSPELFQLFKEHTEREFEGIEINHSSE
jgi:hypothetical protein